MRDSKQTNRFQFVWATWLSPKRPVAFRTPLHNGFGNNSNNIYEKGSFKKECTPNLHLMVTRLSLKETRGFPSLLHSRFGLIT